MKPNLSKVTVLVIQTEIDFLQDLLRAYLSAQAENGMKVVELSLLLKIQNRCKHLERMQMVLQHLGGK